MAFSTLSISKWSHLLAHLSLIKLLRDEETGVEGSTAAKQWDGNHPSRLSLTSATQRGFPDGLVKSPLN